MITPTNKKWWILAGMSMSLALGFLDMTAVAVSLPQIQKLLHSSDIMLQWVVNSYLLLIAVFLILSGQLGDHYGHRRIYLIGAIIFMVASLFCAIAGNIHILVLSRALQGIGSALLIPSVAVIMFNTFPTSQRGKAMGIYIGIASSFLAFGPLLGGVLTEWYSWRMVFWINIPLILICIITAFFIVPKDEIQPRRKVDWLGFVLGGSGIALIVMACMRANNLHGYSLLAVIEFFSSIILLALFVWWERGHAKFPLIDFKIFRDRLYLSCMAVVLVMQFTLMSAVFRAIWFQDVLGYSPANAGLLLLPSTLPILLVSPIAGRMLDKYGTKLPCCIGLILSIIGMIEMAATITQQNYWAVFPGMILVGIGIPLTMSPAMSAALLMIAPSQRGMASGAFNTLRQVSSTVGLAILGMVMATAYSSSLTSFLQKNLLQLNVKKLDGLLSGSSVAHAAVKHLTLHDQALVYQAARDAYSYALAIVSYLCAVMLIVGLLFMMRLLREPVENIERT